MLQAAVSGFYASPRVSKAMFLRHGDLRCVRDVAFFRRCFAFDACGFERGPLFRSLQTDEAQGDGLANKSQISNR